MRNNRIIFPFSLLLIFLFAAVSFAQDEVKTKSEINNTIKSRLNSSAKKDNIDGVVRLRVTFTASGEVSEVRVVSSQVPDTLTEQAIQAARKINFKPAEKNGVSQTVTKLVEYTFTIYYKENDENLRKNAEIIEMPALKFPKNKILKNLSGKVYLTVNLYRNGEVEVTDVKSDLPKELRDEAVKAALKIKFKPAIHKDGSEVTQTKEIEYEFKPQKN